MARITRNERGMKCPEHNLRIQIPAMYETKELDLATLGTQTASIFIPLSAGLRQERLIKCPQID
ncbi:MAG: hypothetical protein V3T59_08495 [Desulfobacterales bacterium]